MKVKQVRTSYDIQEFGKHLVVKHSLGEYNDPYSPALFYGCYREEDIEAIEKHQSVAILLWGGSDAMRLQVLDRIIQLKRSRINPIYHIAPSSYIADDLDRVGIKYLRYNIFPKDEALFQPTPLGDKVYVYASHTRSDRVEFYGLNYLPELKRMFPDVEFIVHYASPITVPFSKMPEIYNECALGLRLVPHDAGSCTVVELALMGRKCVWNGHFPGAIPYRTITDVAQAIYTQVNRAGVIDRQLAIRAKESLSDDSWLYTETYEALDFQPANNLAQGELYAKLV